MLLKSDIQMQSWQTAVFTITMEWLSLKENSSWLNTIKILWHKVVKLKLETLKRRSLPKVWLISANKLNVLKIYSQQITLMIGSD